jgi:hypothetical protein
MIFRSSGLQRLCRLDCIQRGINLFLGKSATLKETHLAQAFLKLSAQI